ncbi:hypothetical protein ACMZ43_04645, partial [Acinetobacter baumannii]
SRRQRQMCIRDSLVYANPDNTVNHTANCIPVQVA